MTQKPAGRRTSKDASHASTETTREKVVDVKRVDARSERIPAFTGIGSTEQKPIYVKHVDPMSDKVARATIMTGVISLFVAFISLVISVVNTAVLNQQVKDDVLPMIGVTVRLDVPHSPKTPQMMQIENCGSGGAILEKLDVCNAATGKCVPTFDSGWESRVNKWLPPQYPIKATWLPSQNSILPKDTKPIELMQQYYTTAYPPDFIRTHFYIDMMFRSTAQEYVFSNRNRVNNQRVVLFRHGSFVWTKSL